MIYVLDLKAKVPPGRDLPGSLRPYDFGETLDFLAGGNVPAGAKVFTDDDADLAGRPIMNFIDKLAPLFGECGVLRCVDILFEGTDGAGD